MKRTTHIYLPGYDVVEEVEMNRSWHFFKAIQHASTNTFLIKKYAKEQITPQDISAATYEYHIMDNLDVKGILKPASFKVHGNQPYLISNFFKANSLDALLKNTTMNIHSMLKIFIKLTTIINDLHNRQIIHKNLNPSNILIDEKIREIKITGFHHAAFLKRENYQAHVNPYLMGNQIGYISPEQTGRLDRYLDYRSDLYSLGVIFYEMLTGKMPFDLTDPLELVYAHIAKTPVPPNKINPLIPKLLSDIVMKLLEKMPESRYQSALGLKEDLMEFDKNYSTEADVSFPLAKKDAPRYFESGGKLFGRDSAKEELINAFRSKVKGFILIQGISGVGKTALVNEIQEPLVQNRGYFISGKFDLLKRQVPYAPLIAAFKDLLKQVLSEGKEKLEEWRERLLTEVPLHLPVISSFLPEIEWIVGKQPNIETLSPVDSHNRVLFAFHNLINVFATERHPLVLFIDDLQWADQATLDLLQYALKQKKQYFLVIGAYRHNEVDSIHPFQIMINELRKNEVSLVTIPLYPLELADLHEWALYLLECEEEDAKYIARFMQRITNGNPFLIQQLFQALYDHQLIVFNEKHMKWTMDISQLHQLPYQEDIVHYVTERFYRLPATTRKLLEMASCIGNQFEIRILSAIKNQNELETAQQLMSALEEGLILPLDPRYKWIYREKDMDSKAPPLVYKFLHDRVQQAIYSSMSLIDRERSHLIIGRLLVAYYKKKDILEDHIFHIVNHLNQCNHHLNGDEKVQLAEWNTLAGEKAKKGTAFKAALTFFEMAYELIGDRKQDPTFIKIILGIGEMAYTNNQFDKAEERFNQALDLVQSREEKLKIYNLKITLFIHQHRVEEAVRSGLRALHLFGMELNEKPSKLAVAKEFLHSKFLLKNRKADDLKNLPKMTDSEQRLIVQTFINMNAPAYHVNQNLATLLMLKAFNFTLKHGTTDSVALVYNNYALILSAGFHNFHDSYEYGKLALYYAKESGNAQLLGRVNFVYGSFINHWKHHLAVSEKALIQSQQNCLKSGNFHLAGANSSFICMTSFLKGHRIQETSETIDQQLQFTQQIQFDLSKRYLNELKGWISYLDRNPEIPDWYSDQFTDDDSAEIVHYSLRLQMSYLLNEQMVAEDLIKKLNHSVDRSLVLVIVPEFYFYEALWLCRMYDQADPNKRKNIFKRIKFILRLFKNWEKYAPENYRHKYFLIKAEEARIKNQEDEAIRYYERAVTEAGKNGFNQDEAIACDCASRFYLEKGFPRLAKISLSSAIKAYEKWGASRIALQLRTRYSQQFGEYHEEYPRANNIDTSSIDISTILKASRTLSGEVMMDKLIKKLLDIVIKNSGAQQGMLFLKTDDQLKLVAKGKVDEVVLLSEEDQFEYPQDIVNFVEKSLEPVVFHSMEKAGLFANDRYIKMNQPKSVLCFPILHQGKMIGILFLENDSLEGAFSQERTEILNLLASQAAVSIENARLYSSLEEKVNKRTALLESAYEQLEEANRELTKSGEIRRQFLSDISHDLRTPITSVRGFIEGILDGTIDQKEEQMYSLERSYQQLLTLNQMIQDLFELAKWESGELSFELEYIPVNQLYDHLSQLIGYEVKKAGLQYVSLYSLQKREGDPLIEVNVRKLEQVMQNLVSNAIRFTDQGTISFELVADENEQYISFLLKDTGTGIPEDELPFIFDRYYTKSADGNGLGLAICKEIIRYHKGTMTVTSKENEGTCFIFHLPVYVIQDHELLDLV
ncbi:ATP-binding sensor histidine kinase [Bacillus niameyensis]|uniref:ATP-binding sensor histidine kinase n=1 Tax=Bacillus niameyensis TaxID=1522308 RepID=UPI000782B99E|nr:ATP-binding sensor histidine kinase [Bacillus niameyensis]